MKITLRFATIMLTVILLFTTLPVGATFSDVPVDLNQKEAVDVLSGLGLISGYQEGEKLLFKPEGQITRAEFTAMLTRALNLAEIGATGTNPFEDVASDHWAAANIAVAYGLGIIRGYDATHFGPEDQVTYEQAIKMIVCALGYEQQAVARGGYPGGYFLVASDKKLLDKLGGAGSTPAVRADIAQMIYNSFDVRMAAGNEERPGTLLEEKLGLKRLSGQVTGISQTRLDRPQGIAKDNCIEIDGVPMMVPENTDQVSLSGRSVEVYYTTDLESDILTARYIHLPDRKNKTLTITADQIEEVTDTELIYETPEGKSVTVEFSDLAIIYNKIQSAGRPSVDLDIESGSITLLDADGNKSYDVAFVSEYTSLCVYQVDAIRGAVTNYYDRDATAYSIKPTTGKSGDRLKLYMDGKEVDASVVKSMNSLTIYESKNTTGDKLTEIYVSAKSVRGKVEKIRDGVYTVAGKEYEATPYYQTFGSGEVSLGYEATFYLDINNKIVSSKAAAAASVNLLGYVVDAVYNEDTELLTIKLLPAGQSKIVSYVCTEKITIDGAVKKEHLEVQSLLAVAAANTNRDPGNRGAVYTQVIRYALKDNQINAINTNLYAMASSNIHLYESEKISGEYNSTKKNFALDKGITMNSSTKIFVVPSDRDDYDQYATTLSMRNGNTYTIEAYNVSSLAVAGVVVIYGGKDLDELVPTTPLYIIAGEPESVLDKEEIVYSVPLIEVETGAKKTFNIEAGGTLPEGTQKGDVIRFLANSDGTIRSNKVEVMFSPTAARPDLEDREFSDTTTLRTRLGVIYSKDVATKEISFTNSFPDEEEGERDTYSCSSAKIYVYDTTAQKEENRIVPHNATTTNLMYAQTTYDMPEDAVPSTVFLRLNSGVVKFVYIVY